MKGVPHDPQRAFRVARADHMVARVFQVDCDQLLDCGFVFDDQNVYSHRAVPGLRFIMRIV